MKKASEVLGLKVLGIREGIENGIAQDFMIDPESKKVEYLILKTNQGYGFTAIKVEDITGIGSDYIMTNTVENAKKMYESKEILKEIEKGFFILGTTVLASTGDVAGQVEDFSFDETNGKIGTLYLDNQVEFDGSKIVTMAGKMVFVDPQGAEFFRAEREEKITRIQDEERADEAQGNTFENESMQFLLGKTVKQTVTNSDGSLVIAEGTVLGEEILQKAATDNDMLLTLTMNVRSLKHSLRRRISQHSDILSA